MSSKILLKLRQSNGEMNRFRIFFNGELLDEADTTTSWQDFMYDIDVIQNDINFLMVQVLNQKTLVDDDRNILSSNSIQLSKDSAIKWQKNDSTFKLNHIFFIRDIDPIYEIYARQNNIDYKKFYFCHFSSVGKGKFLYAFIPHAWDSPSTQQFRTQFHDDFYFNHEDQTIYDEKTTKETIIKKLNAHYEGDISDHLDVNIHKLLKYYNED